MDFLLKLVPTFEHLGNLGYLFIFLICFAESLVVVGTFIPGTTAVVLAGFLSSQGYLDIGDLILFSTIGAILGDSVSFYLGTKGTRYFKNENKFMKLHHLDKGKEFFKRHGNKSVFIARFISFVRAIVPFIAGLSKMSVKKFLFWNITSALVWSVAHLLAGYFFGSAIERMGKWVSRAGLFLFIIGLFSFVVWLVIKYREKIAVFFKASWSRLIHKMDKNGKLTAYLNRHPRMVHFTKSRISMDSFVGLPLTLLVISFLYVSSLLLGITRSVLQSDVIVGIDQRFAEFLYSFRDPTVVKTFLWITSLGTFRIILGLTIMMVTVFWILKKKTYIYGLLITITGSSLFVYFGKTFVNRKRPGEAIPYYQELSLSFPSGHSAIAVAMYGFILYFAWHYLKKWKSRTAALFLTVLIILLIGMSRMYLGEHYLSDVLGGYLVGLTWLIVGITTHEWILHNRKAFPQKDEKISTKVKYTIILLVMAQVAFYIYYAATYTPVLNTFVTQIISTS